ncbi:Kiwa anti-phage protein KwaB-like domain-containing protein [Sodalis sp. RH16]|uniref:Kiwa anti-phage protein KwaB-like domain-containing protein n=1 Tax=Sodalis sp. RH16 TaxID=3394331 RepID=UPI0039B52C22
MQNVNNRRAWGLNFDTQSGKLIPSVRTIKTIINVLLDHRLTSEITDLIYDAPDATQV